MMAISMAWTTPAMHAQQKYCTRRDWSAKYVKLFSAGQELIWLDKDRRYGGTEQGRIVLTQTPYRESTADMPDEDWEHEGFAYLSSIGHTVNGRSPRHFWDDWKTKPVMLWVVRFEYLPISKKRSATAAQLELFT